MNDFSCSPQEWSVGAVDKRALTPQLCRVHSFHYGQFTECWVVYGFGQFNNAVHLPLKYHTEEIYWPKVLGALTLDLFLPRTPDSHIPLYSTDLLFPEYHTV